MSKRIVRWLMAAFVALLFLVIFSNSPNVKNTILGPKLPEVLQKPADSPWARRPARYPVTQFTFPPSEPPLHIPKIQHQFDTETAEQKQVRERRLKTIKESFGHTWKGYRQHAWMRDEIAPLTAGFRDNYGGWAVTLVDSLDTLWMMGFKSEFDEAVLAVSRIDFSHSPAPEINIFETTIRYLGGLLGAYDLSERPILLEKAIELGEMIYAAFDTPNRMPVTKWNWSAALEGKEQMAGDFVLSAEIGSLSLELTRLSQLTGDPKFFDAIQRITDAFRQQQDKSKLPGMWPIAVNARYGDFSSLPDFSLGAMADSLYEYLPKVYMLLGGHRKEYREMYEKAIETAKRELFFRPMVPNDADILISGIAIATEEGAELRPDAQHLVCFVGGMVGIGAKIFERKEDLSVARKLVDGCIWAYETVPKGIMPEAFTVAKCGTPCHWDYQVYKQQVVASRVGTHGHGEVDVEALGLPPGMVQVLDGRYKLRPEAIESVFVMYRITGDPVLQEQGWKMFQAIEAATRAEFGHATLKDVLDANSVKVDVMESFWMAETLKYFYLLFREPGFISLDEYVFNTEAHPFKRPTA